MKPTDVLQPPEMYQDQIYLFGRMALARVAVLVNADYFYGSIKPGEMVRWRAEVMMGRLAQANSDLKQPIEYHKPSIPAPEDEIGFDYPVPTTLRVYTEGEYPIGQTISRPRRGPNHYSPIVGTNEFTQGIVSVSLVGNEQPRLKYWPVNCLAPTSIGLCRSLMEANFASITDFPELGQRIYTEWMYGVAHMSDQSPAFAMP